MDIPFLTKAMDVFFWSFLAFMVAVKLFYVIKAWIEHNKRERQKELEENEELLERLWKKAEKPSIDIEV